MKDLTPKKTAVILILGASLSLGGCRAERQSALPPTTSNRPIQIQIDFNGRGSNKQFGVDWTPELTVFGSLEQLQSTGQISVSRRGTGDQTLLTAIDGLENLWAAGDNWIYYVNDRMGDRSSAVYALQPGDVVVWRFGKYAPK